MCAAAVVRCAEGQKSSGGPVFCELEHVPPSHLESSWQQHQTFMRAMEKSVKDSVDPGMESARLAGLMGLISASSSNHREPSGHYLGARGAFFFFHFFFSR